MLAGADCGNVPRAALTAALTLAVAAAGCGDAAPDDGPVRALMHRYLNAMITQDWALACAQLTPEAAEERHRSAPSNDCQGALAFESGTDISAPPPNAHPERSGEEFQAVRINRIEMRDRSAQVYVEERPGDEFILVAVRRGGRWLLAQDLEPGIPVDASGAVH